MRNLDLNRINLKKIELGEKPLVLKKTEYPEPIVKDGYLVVTIFFIVFNIV